jgi:aminoglycoside phosphotransferase (APT) family kinase protein
MSALPPEHDIHRHLERWLRSCEPDSRLVEVRPLSGGVSSTMTAFTTCDGTTETTRVLRQPNDWTLAHVPDAVRREHDRLAALFGEGLPVQRPRFLDETGAHVDRPGFVIDYVEGTADFAPADIGAAADGYADLLARIHRIDPATEGLGLDSLARHPFDVTVPDALGDLPVDAMRAALQAATSQPARNDAVLLHGDVWPGNVLWQDGELAAIIDWEDAAAGDPLQDLSITRLDLFWAFGQEAAQRATGRYLQRTDLDARQLPLWDLLTALRPGESLATWATNYPGVGRPDVTVQSMEEARTDFVRRALADLDS